MRPRAQAARPTRKSTKEVLLTALPSPACSRAYARLIAKCPHSFQIVKISHFWTEDVDDYVVRINQNPIRCREPFDPNVPTKSLLDLVAKLNGHRCDLPG